MKDNFYVYYKAAILLKNAQKSRWFARANSRWDSSVQPLRNPHQRTHLNFPRSSLFDQQKVLSRPAKSSTQVGDIKQRLTSIRVISNSRNAHESLRLRIQLMKFIKSLHVWSRFLSFFRDDEDSIALSLRDEHDRYLGREFLF